MQRGTLSLPPLPPFRTHHDDSHSTHAHLPSAPQNHSLFYFYTKLDITKVVPAACYFGYMTIISLGFFALTGSIGGQRGVARAGGARPGGVLRVRATAGLRWVRGGAPTR